ncbi:MAG: N-acetylmuramoyl-L-alanine amidase [Robiginitomaculum sp.]|nr:MAG: N-acetylmuramoyl-L-alanine amidase [Robiginitomaculum sp.]
MKIIQTPSPNFNERTLPISLLVLHYTGMETGGAALERMCDPDAKVSAHYMVSETGEISQMVAEKDRAWHAGVSSWGGETNINSASIGIEIVNGGHDYGLPDFPRTQIDAVIGLCSAVMKRHNIPDIGVVAHSDIAADRKEDPGEKFPWQTLAKEGVGYWPDLEADGDTRCLFASGARDRGVAIMQSGLAYLGYDVEITGVIDGKTMKTITAFQRRYRPQNIGGIIDVQTMEILTHLIQNKQKRGHG